MATKKKLVDGKIEAYIVVYRDGDTWDVCKETNKTYLKGYDEILHIIPVETKIVPKDIDKLMGTKVVL